jgi:hypothetical protein
VRSWIPIRLRNPQAPTRTSGVANLHSGKLSRRHVCGWSVREYQPGCRSRQACDYAQVDPAGLPLLSCFKQENWVFKQKNWVFFFNITLVPGKSQLLTCRPGLFDQQLMQGPAIGARTWLHRNIIENHCIVGCTYRDTKCLETTKVCTLQAFMKHLLPYCLVVLNL